MWAIIKVDNKNIKILSNELKKNLVLLLKFIPPKFILRIIKIKKSSKKA